MVADPPVLAALHGHNAAKKKYRKDSTRPEISRWGSAMPDVR
jgi:hypothetical protein